jgi:hypothetical protein
MLNFFPTLDAKNSVSFNGTKTFSLLMSCSEKIQTNLFEKKILTSLPTLLRERVRNKIEDIFISKAIPYDQLTYVELVILLKKKVLRFVKTLNFKNTLSGK